MIVSTKAIVLSKLKYKDYDLANPKIPKAPSANPGYIKLNPTIP